MKEMTDKRDKYIDFIPVDLENVSTFMMNEDEFSNGIDIGSRVAGVYSALKNMDSTLSNSEVLKLLENMLNNGMIK